VTATYDAWLRFVFAHDVREPEWYWDESFDDQFAALALTPQTTTQYLRRLLSRPSVLAPYTLPQVAQAIWFLVGKSSPSEALYALRDKAIPLGDRRAVIAEITTFFRESVAPMAPGTADTQRDPFHIACFMWWDIIPTHATDSELEPELRQSCLDAMIATLAVDNDLCHIAALHGLNHWHVGFPELVASTVDAFIGSRRERSTFVREYAPTARSGAAG